MWHALQGNTKHTSGLFSCIVPEWVGQYLHFVSTFQLSSLCMLGNSECVCTCECGGVYLCMLFLGVFVCLFCIPYSSISHSLKLSIDHCKTTPSVSQAHTYIPQVWCMGSVAAEWLLLKRNPRGSLALFIQQHFILSLWLWLRKGSTQDFFLFFSFLFCIYCPSK